MRICVICQQSFYPTRTFKLHIKRVHDITLLDYTIKYVYHGVHPTCACGCGVPVSWRNDAYFMKLVKGHVTQRHRDAQSLRRLGKKNSLETKMRQSSSLLEFFSTERGKELAKQRANSLKIWRKSVLGQEDSVRRSLKLRQCYATADGQIRRTMVGNKVSSWRRNNPNAMRNMGYKLRLHWSSCQGKSTLHKRSTKLRNFYASDRGKLVISAMSEKISAKNKLSREKFDAKLSIITSNFFVEQELPLYESYVNQHESLDISLDVTCRNSGHKQNRKFVNIVHVPRCLICTSTYSKPQHQIAEFVRTLGFDVVINDRSILHPLELDVWVPNAKFAIEYCGLYWHSEAIHSDKNHINKKHELAAEKGVDLLTIFSDEWNDSEVAVKNTIRRRLNSLAISSNELSIVDLESDEAQEFFANNYINGYVQSHKAFGLRNKLDDKLLAALITQFTLFNEEHGIEIIAYTTVPELSEISALRILLARVQEYAIENNCYKIFANVDVRIDDVRRYESLGFERMNVSDLDVWYTDFVARSNNCIDKKNVCKIWGTKRIVYIKHVI